MLSLPETMQLYLALDPVDMRKAIDGLSVIVADALSRNPQSGDLFIFYNKQRNKVKLLTWDKNGFLMMYKRLEKGRFKLPKNPQSANIKINEDQLNWLLAGFDFMRIPDYPEMSFSRYF